MSITAVIVNFHTASLLSGLIRDLDDDASVTRIIVVDNSKEISESSPPFPMPSTPVKLIINDENSGFGAAVNQALAYADGRWILIVNPDMRLRDNCAGRLLEAAQRHGSLLVGPRFYWDDRMLFRLPPATGASLRLDFANQSAGRFELDAEMLSFYWIIRHERFWEAKAPFFEPFLSGACLLVNRELIELNRGRLFDDRFFLYYEDTDLCVRAIQHGVRPLCVPQANTIHYYDQSPSTDNAKPNHRSHAHSLFLGKYFGKDYHVLLSHLSDTPLLISNVIDLGELHCRPIFEFAECGTNEESFFEIGINAYFVPFAQIHVTGAMLEFPSDVWSRLAPGQYFGRVRGSISGTVEVWKWMKL